jgi:hypothetical protein
LFLLDNRQLSNLLYCHGVSRLYGHLYSILLLKRDATKAETLAFRLRAVLKKTPRYETLRKVLLQHFFSTSPPYAAQNGVDSELQYTYSTELRLCAVLYSAESLIFATVSANLQPYAKII